MALAAAPFRRAPGSTRFGHRLNLSFACLLLLKSHSDGPMGVGQVGTV